MRKLFAFTLALCLASFPVLALAQAESEPSALNRAGEQRMLSQRIAKLYSQIGLNILPSPATEQLNAASARFERNLAALKPAASSAKAAAAFVRLETEWLGLKKAVAVAISREAAQALTGQAEATLAAAEVLTSVFAQENPQIDSRAVNLAGRQRMLSQRIANNYLLRSWGVESSAVRENLASSARDFSAGLAKLRAREDNSAEIRSELEEVAQQWEWLQASLSVEGASFYRVIVAESADALLEATDRVTRLFEQQSRR